MNRLKSSLLGRTTCGLLALLVLTAALASLGRQNACADEVYDQTFEFRAMQPYKIELRPSADEFGVYDYVKEGLVKLMVFSPEEMYGISVYGSLVSYIGNDKWMPVYSGYQSDTYNFSDIWGSSAGNTYLINNNGLYRYNGLSLTLVEAVENPARVWGTSAGDVYVARSDVGLYRYDGSAWSLVDHFSGKKVNCVGGFAGRVYAGTADGLHFFDGSAWTQAVAGKAATSIGATADGKVIACYGREVTWQGEPGGEWTSLGLAPMAPSRIGGTALDDLYAIMGDQLYLRKNIGYWHLVKKADGSQLAAAVKDFHVFGRRDFLAVGLDNPYMEYYFSTPILYHYDDTPTIPPPEIVDADREVTAYLRVEGYDGTIIPRTQVTLRRFGLGQAGGAWLNPATGSSANPYSQGWGIERFEGGPTALHILLKELEAQGFLKYDPYYPQHEAGRFDVQDYGWSLYVAMLDGDREFGQGGMSGWLYRVNGWLPNYGSQYYALEDGDEVVWCYTATGFDAYYVNFQADRETVTAGQSVNFTLMGETTDLSGESGVGETVVVPIADATMLVNGEPCQVGGNPLKTDAEGKASITFSTPGQYTVSCEDWDIFGEAGAVRPASITITVNEAAPGTNHRPAAADQSAAATVGEKYTLDLSAIFSDPDGDPLTYSIVGDDGAADAVLNADGRTLEYTPAAADAGRSVVITVKANDGQEDSDPVTVTLTVSQAPPEPDTIPPAFADDYPRAANVTTGGFDLLIQLDEPGTAYYKVVADGTAPGSDYESWTAVPIPDTGEVSAAVGGLTAATDYEVYVIAKDAAGNWQAAPEKLEVTTAEEPDTRAPAFADDYPRAANVTTGGFDLLIQLDEAGTAYYKVVGEGTAPGSDYESWTAVPIPDTGEVSAAVGGLTAATDYDVYVIARDTANNWQAAPEQLEVTTAAEPSPTPPGFAEGYPLVANITVSGFDLRVKLSVAGTVYYKTVTGGTPITTEPGQTVAQAVYQNPDGSLSLPALNEADVTIVGLAADTAYDVYLVVRDTAGNLQEEPEKLEVTTAGSGQAGFTIERVGEGGFELGSDAHVTVKITNNNTVSQQATLIVCLYDNQRSNLVNYSFLSRALGAGEEVNFSGGFPIPDTGDYSVKVLVWDTVENMEPLLEDPLVIEVS